MSDPASDRLIGELETRLREVELVVGMRVMSSWADARQLSLEQARMLLVLATSKDGCTAAELAELSGIDVTNAYPALGQLRERGLVREDQRRYRLTDRGEESLASLNEARREGILAYVARLAEDDRRNLEAAFGVEPLG